MMYYDLTIQPLGHCEMSYTPSSDSSPSGRSPKLLDRVRDRIRRKGYAKRTEQAYVHWIKRYILFHGKSHPAEMGKNEVEVFLTSLAVDRKKIWGQTRLQTHPADAPEQKAQTAQP